ncbi:MAG: tRNA lysidine(34) synthetase TilS [Phycisphaerales bacterium]|nr:tRNA lysidine(34) synthetase TilS [Phycisphaerales bacterium]
MSWESLLDDLRVWLSERGLLTPDAPWVVGASGGPDSTLLLHALAETSRRESLGWTLHVAHLHHGLRGADADADAAFVEETARGLGLTFHGEKADIRGQVETEGGSSEEVARARRYEFFERIALLTGADRVAVGHHADDNAETVLHRICRGTGLRGLAGMSEIRAIQPGSRIRLMRPLLPRRRAEIERICESRGLAYRVDQSNSSPQHTRNRIRHTVLPLLREQLNPNVSEALLRLAEQASWLGTYLEDAAARVFDSLLVAEQPRYLALNTAALGGKQRVIQAEIVRRAVSIVLQREQELSFTHIEAVLRLAADGGSGKELHLPGPVLVRKRYEKLEFLPLEDTQEGALPPEFAPIAVHCPGRTPMPVLGCELIVEQHDVSPERIRQLVRGGTRFEEWVDAERVLPPLTVRARREGDRFTPLGSSGSKSISDFFIDAKIEPQLRGRMGLLCDRDGPIWVMPMRIDERVKLRPTTRRALRLLLAPANRANGARA